MAQDWTATDLARQAGTTSRWVRDLCTLGNAGPFPGAHKRAGAWFIPDKQARAWLDQRAKVKP